MAYKLCNPTPFVATIDWEPGRPIVIEPDSSVELSHEQGDDFRADKPGSDNVREVTEPQGVFLFDDSRNYDIQALEALGKAAKRKMDEYRRRVDNLKKLKSEQGIMPDAESLAQMIEDHGLNRLKMEADACDNRAKKIAKVVEGVDEIVHQTFDPERTCYVLDTGPREFPSKLALELFLDENPSIKKRHEEYLSEENEEK